MELLGDYIRAVPALQINDSNNIASLQEQQEELGRKQDEKDKQIQDMQKRLAELEEQNGKRFETWLGENLSSVIESKIREYLQPDSEHGSNISKEEFARRNRQYPELAAAAEKLLSHKSENDKKL